MPNHLHGENEGIDGALRNSTALQQKNEGQRELILRRLRPVCWKVRYHLEREFSGQHRVIELLGDSQKVLVVNASPDKSLSLSSTVYEEEVYKTKHALPIAGHALFEVVADEWAVRLSLPLCIRPAFSQTPRPFEVGPLSCFWPSSQPLLERQSQLLCSRL